MAGSDDVQRYADVQHYTDKESDGGSPASQEHPDSEHPFAESHDKDVENRAGSLSCHFAVSEQGSQEVGAGSGENTTEEAIVQIEWELKSEEDYGSKEESIKSKEGLTGGSSGNSSPSSRSSSNSNCSSSHDDSYVQKKVEVVETGHAVDTLSEVAKQVDTSISGGENSNAISETASMVTPDIALLIELVQMNESNFGDHLVTPVCDNVEVQEVGYKLKVPGSADKQLLNSDNSTGKSPVMMDLGSRKEENEAVSTLEDINNSAMEDKDAKLLLSFNAPTAHASKDAHHIIAFDSPECSESQVKAFVFLFVE